MLILLNILGEILIFYIYVCVCNLMIIKYDIFRYNYWLFKLIDSLFKIFNVSLRFFMDGKRINTVF